MRRQTILRCALFALALSGATPSHLSAQASTVYWPLSASTVPDDVDKPFGFRVLCGNCTDPDDADFHRGLDFKAPSGTPVYAVFSGEVVRVRKVDSTSSDPLSRWGRFVVIALDDVTRPDGTVLSNHKVAYLHLKSVDEDLDVGDSVARGAYLGTVGNSGVGINTVHLHFDYYQGSDDQWIRAEEARNPLEILPYAGQDPAVEVSLLSSSVLRLTVRQDAGSLDVVGFRVEHDGLSDPHGTAPIEIDFNEKVGINMDEPDFEDRNPFQGTTFRPVYFNATHSAYTLAMDFDGDWSDLATVTVTLTNAHDEEFEETFILQ